MERLNIISDTAEEAFSQVQNITEDTNLTCNKRNKELENMKEKLKDLKDKVAGLNTHPAGVPEEENREFSFEEFSSVDERHDFSDSGILTNSK